MLKIESNIKVKRNKINKHIHFPLLYMLCFISLAAEDLTDDVGVKGVRGLRN